MQKLKIENMPVEFEYLMIRVAALENALRDAGIPIPKNAMDLAREAEAEHARIRSGR